MTNPLTIISVDRSGTITDAIRKATATENAEIHQLASLDPTSNGWPAASPDMLLVDLCVADTPASAFDWIEQYKRRHPDVAVIVFAGDQAPELVLAAMRAGAQEFLPIPVPEEQLSDALTRIRGTRRQQAPPSPSVAGKIISVFSSKGGLGVSTIAVNLGVGLALVSEQDQGLLGLDFHVGDVTSMLDLQPEYNLLDVLNGGERIELETLQSSLTFHDSGLFVLAEPPDPRKAIVSATQVHGILSGFKEAYPYTIVDLPHTLDPQTLTAFELSDEIFLVTVANISALRATKRSLDMLEQYGFGYDRMHVILNRASRKDDISRKDVEKALDCEVFWSIPNDYRRAVEAINAGEPLVHSGRMSKVGKSIYEMAEYIYDATADE